MKRFSLVLATTLLVAGLQAAHAETWKGNKYLKHNEQQGWNPDLPIDQGPGKYAWWWQYDDKQYGYFYIIADAKGSAEAHFQFSNGKKWDGDTFNAAVALVSADGSVAKMFEWRAGMNSAGWSGGAKERHNVFKFKLSPDQWDQIVGIRAAYQLVDSQDDAKFWEGVTNLLSELLKSEEDEQELQN